MDNYSINVTHSGGPPPGGMSTLRWMGWVLVIAVTFALGFAAGKKSATAGYESKTVTAGYNEKQN